MYKIITTIKSTETAIYDEEGTLVAEWANDDGIPQEEKRYCLTPQEIEHYM